MATKAVDYDLVGSYDNQRYSSISAQRTINLFEYMDPEGKRPKMLLPTSGLINGGFDFGGLSGGCRAAFVFNNAIYQIVGNKAFRTIGTAGSFITTELGMVSNSSGYAAIEANTFQVIFVDGDQGFIYDTSTTEFKRITDPGFPAKPIDVTYIDGFFVVAHGTTNEFQLSEYNQGLIWGSDYSAAEALPFLAAGGGSANLVLSSGTTGAYVVNSPITFSGVGTLPTGTPAISKNTTYYIHTIVNSTTFTISTTVGGIDVTFSTTGTAPIFVTNNYVGNAFLATSGASPNLVLINGTTLNYQVGTPVEFNGSGTLPVGTPPIEKGVTYYVKRVIGSGGTTFTISDTLGGTEITFSSTGTAPIYVSNNGQLQLGTISSHPGTIVACRTLHRRVFLFSQNFTEVWENAGAGTNLPLRRTNSLLMEIGTPSTGSVSVGFDRMFFLAQDKDGLSGVVEVKGTESLPVSNRALDYQLGQYAANYGVSDARGILVKENGLIFYRLNFTSANHTFVFNVSMSSPESPKWHEEEVLNGDRHPAQTHFYYEGINYYGDYEIATVYVVGSTISTNDGEPIKRTRIGKQMSPQGYVRLRIDRFQVDLLQGDELIIQNMSDVLLTEAGEALLTENGIELITEQTRLIVGPQPVVYLSYSKDGGQTYGNHLLANIGKLGEYTYRTVWRKLGTTPRGQGFIPKIEFFNDYPFIILGAAWAYEELPE